MDNETITPAPAEPLQPRLEIVATPNYKPVVTFVILGITVLVYLWQIATLFVYNIDYPGAFGAKINEAIIAGSSGGYSPPCSCTMIACRSIFSRICISWRLWAQDSRNFP